MINQSILTYAQWCQDLTIPGVSVSVAQATAGPVVITQPAGGLTVSETGSGPIGTIAAYDVSLAQAPNCGGAGACNVYVTITAEAGTLQNRTSTPSGDSVLLALGANPAPARAPPTRRSTATEIINGVADISAATHDRARLQRSQLGRPAGRLGGCDEHRAAEPDDDLPAVHLCPGRRPGVR